MLFDRIGPHRVIALFAALCSTGALLFAAATTVPLACAGRVLTGVGCGGGFLGIVVAASTFRPAQMGLMLGIASVSGFGLGAFGAAAPLKALVSRVGWRAATALSASLPAAVCLALLPACCRAHTAGLHRVASAPASAHAAGGATEQARSRLDGEHGDANQPSKPPPASAAALSPDPPSRRPQPSVLAQVRGAASQPTVWLWGLLGGGLDAQSNTIFGLLGFSLLSDANGWPAGRAALAMSLISIPVGVANFGGSAVCSWLRSNRARCALVCLFALVGLAGLLLLALVNKVEVAAWAGLTMVALSIGGEGTLWVMVAEGISDEGKGGAVGGLVNTIIVLVDAVAQPVCAFVMGKWHAMRLAAHGGSDAGDPSAPQYGPADFQAGLAPLGVLYAVVLGCALALRNSDSGSRAAKGGSNDATGFSL